MTRAQFRGALPPDDRADFDRLILEADREGMGGGLLMAGMFVALLASTWRWWLPWVTGFIR